MAREVYIEIPPEDRQPGDENKIARLKMSLYGTRDAAQNWVRCYTSLLQKLGFERGKASTCNFIHRARNWGKMTELDCRYIARRRYSGEASVKIVSAPFPRPVCSGWSL